MICLGELLREHEIRFDVLSRGYGRRTRGVAVVDPAGTAGYGDEPILIAQRLGVPVIVGSRATKPDYARNRVSVLNCTCWTTAFSTANSREASTS